MRVKRSSGSTPISFEPDVGGLVVVLVDRHPQLLGRQAVDLGEKIPGVADRVALEVVAEAEVAEHLEEGVMARGVADVLQVVVLAAGAHAALRGGRAHVAALVAAEEHVLELHHAGIGEQQGRIIAGHQRARRHDLVAVAIRNKSRKASRTRRWSSWHHRLSPNDNAGGNPATRQRRRRPCHILFRLRSRGKSRIAAQ